VKNQNYSSASHQEGNRTAITLNQEIRKEWKELWNQRIEDKLIAEDVASKTYELLFIERGVVLRASKDYKPPELEKIIEMNEKILGKEPISPDPNVGGWRKFSKEVLSKQPRQHNSLRKAVEISKKPKSGQLKKGGRGWLHIQ
jgi:hypothetical protein